jgi:hypothetical protein
MGVSYLLSRARALAKTRSPSKPRLQAPRRSCMLLVLFSSFHRGLRHRRNFQYHLQKLPELAGRHFKLGVACCLSESAVAPPRPYRGSSSWSAGAAEAVSPALTATLAHELLVQLPTPAQSRMRSLLPCP